MTHVFPTRRSSDLRKQALFPDSELFTDAELRGNLRELTRSLVLRHTDFGSLEKYLDGYSIAGSRLAGLRIPATILTRSEEHTSELQSLMRISYAVFCLKKKNIRIISHAIYI